MSNLAILKRIKKKYPNSFENIQKMAFVNYKGVLSYTDGFVVSNSAIHPLYEDSEKGTFVNEIVERSFVSSVPTEASTNKNANISVVAPEDRIPEGISTFPFSYTSLTEGGEGIQASYMDWDNTKVGQPLGSPTVFPGAKYINLRPEIDAPGWSIDNYYSRPYVSKRYPTVHLRSHGLVSSGTNPIVKCSSMSKETLNILKLITASLYKELDTDMPVQFWNSSGSFTEGVTTMGGVLPRLRGYQRVAYRIPSVSAVDSYPNMKQLVCYVLGEGPDLIVDDFNLYQQMKKNSVSKRFLCQEVLMRTLEPVSYANYFGVRPVEKWWAISGLPWVTSIDTANMTLTDSSTIEVDGQPIQVDVYSSDVKGAIANITSADYAKYITTGLYVYEPMKGEAAESEIATWNNVTENGVAVRIGVQDLSNLSVRNLNVYNEYGRARDKACKTNDFMSKPYNQKFLYSEIEDRLKALGKVSVTAIDLATAEAYIPVSHEFVTITFDNTAKTVTHKGTVYPLSTLDEIEAFYVATAATSYSTPSALSAHIDVVTAGSNSSVEFADMRDTQERLYVEAGMMNVMNFGMHSTVPDASALDEQQRIKFGMLQVADFSVIRANMINLMSAFSVTRIY